MSIFATFKSKMSAVVTPMIYYSLAVCSFICAHYWALELESKGYFSLRIRYHTSYFEGDGALSTILAMKFIGLFLFLACVYYTISAAKFIREYKGPFKNDKKIEFNDTIKEFKTFQYAKFFSYITDKLFSFLNDIFFLKFCYVIFWLISVSLIYYYLRLDSVFIFILMSLPFLILTLFLPLSLLDILIDKKGDIRNALKKPSKIKAAFVIFWMSCWVIALAILFTTIDPYTIILVGIVFSPIILLLFFLPLITLLGSSKKV